MKTIVQLLGTAVLVAAFTTLGAHEGGHKTPKTLPPFGPHGGQYAKLTKHYAEVVVRGNTARIYILERDIKAVAEDATGVSATLEVPRKFRKRLRLKKQKKTQAYLTRVRIPRGARRVYFHIRCKLDGKWEKGKILYEPRR